MEKYYLQPINRFLESKLLKILKNKCKNGKGFYNNINEYTIDDFCVEPYVFYIIKCCSDIKGFCILEKQTYNKLPFEYHNILFFEIFDKKKGIGTIIVKELLYNYTLIVNHSIPSAKSFWLKFFYEKPEFIIDVKTWRKNYDIIGKKRFHPIKRVLETFDFHSKKPLVSEKYINKINNYIKKIIPIN